MVKSQTILSIGNSCVVFMWIMKITRFKLIHSFIFLRLDLGTRLRTHYILLLANAYTKDHKYAISHSIIQIASVRSIESRLKFAFDLNISISERQSSAFQNKSRKMINIQQSALWMKSGVTATTEIAPNLINEIWIGNWE